jgi:hypothetical protein
MKSTIYFWGVCLMATFVIVFFSNPIGAVAGDWKKASYYGVISNLNGAKAQKYGSLALMYDSNDNDAASATNLFYSYQYIVRARDNAETAKNYALNAYLANPTSQAYNAYLYAVNDHNYKSKAANLIYQIYYNDINYVAAAINNMWYADSKNGWSIFYSALYSNNGID